jgi:hypothetical protein
MSRRNEEQEEAALVDKLIQPKLDDLIGKGGILVARKATVDDEDNLHLHYYVAMPAAANCIEMQLEVRRRQ